MKNFLKGAASILEIYPSTKYKYSFKTDKEAYQYDKKMIESDWKQIGDDFKSIIDY